MSSLLRSVLALMLVGGAAVPIAAQPSPPGAATLSEEQLRAYLTFIAADSLEGRETPSRGLDVAAGFIAALLTRWGLEPAGDEGSFFQTIALTRRQLDRSATRLAVGPRTLELGRHFLPLATASGTAEGTLAYVGYGYVVTSKQIDPYATVDVRGRIVIMHPGLPPGLERRDLQGPQGEDWEDGPTAAARHGAVGILYLPDLRTLETWDDRLAAIADEGSISVDAFSAARTTLPTAYLAPAAYSTIFRGEPVDAAEVHRRVADRDAAAPFALAADKRVTLTVGLTETPATTQNVVAIWRGGDPRLRDEYVALGAHYDHIGTRPTAGGGGDRIYNGADDDGSGTVALLGMAEALAHAPSRPRRSTLFVWHAGEEKGLWGARYFTDHPTVPLDRIVTQLNIDMIGRSRPEGDTAPANEHLTGAHSVYVIGSRLMSTELGALVDQVNERTPGLTYDYSYADPKDPNQFFYRSDHYHYAKHGIPIAFYFSGVHQDYHGLDDEVAGIDFVKLRRVAATIYATLWELGTRPTRPTVDTPLARELLTR